MMMTTKKESEQLIVVRIILEKPAVNTLYGVQTGKGNSYETIQRQLSDSEDLLFDLELPVKQNKEGLMILCGPIVQGSPTEKFLYIDIGSYAGQTDAPISGRLKVPLPGASALLTQAIQQGSTLVTKIRGTKDKDGSPVMGTVKPFGGWTLK